VICGNTPLFPADVEKQQKAFQLLQKENAGLVALSDQLPVELEQLQAELEAEKEAYESARSAVEQAEYARERKKKHLREGHELYESRLALKITTSKKDGEALPLSYLRSVPSRATSCELVDANKNRPAGVRCLCALSRKHRHQDAQDRSQQSFAPILLLYRRGQRQVHR